MKYTYPFLLCIAVLAIAYYQFLWLQGLGFPDGHITDFERSCMSLYKAFIVASIVYGIYFIYIGIRAMRNRVHAKFIAPLVTYIFVGLATAGIEYYFWLYLDHGGGG